MKEKIMFFYGQVQGHEGKGGVEITENDTILFVEKTEGANSGNFTLKGGHFLFFKENFLANNLFREITTLRNIGDGAAIELDSQTLCIVEIKSSIGFKTYKKLLQQLSASYLKMLLNLSIVASPHDFKVQFFIVGEWIKESVEDQTANFEEAELSETQLISRSYYKMRKENYFVFPDFPHIAHLTNNISDLYKKKKVKIRFYIPNSTHDFLNH